MFSLMTPSYDGQAAASSFSADLVKTMSWSGQVWEHALEQHEDEKQDSAQVLF